MTDNDAPMQRMLPCPFCGGNAEYQTNKGPTGELYGWVGCTQCGAASDLCDVRSMQPEEIHPIDAWSARVTSPCDGRTEQLLKDVEGVANLLAQWRTTVMCRFDGSVDGDQWRELNKAFDDLATVRAALRTTPQAKPLDLPAQDEVEVVARAIHEHLSRRDIMQYLDNDEDCRGLATAAIAALDRHRAGDDALREENARLREALEIAAIRLAYLSGQIEASHGISGTLRAEQAMKARHMSDEARAALTGGQG